MEKRHYVVTVPGAAERLILAKTAAAAVRHVVRDIGIGAKPADKLDLVRLLTSGVMVEEPGAAPEPAL